ncbi:hypothetical protein ACMAZF_01350 [Psychrobium sp. nBUS_13]|uniref:hypothetical protein n=1 Tax=Psychrobium sp. nBUS_13 TaxID=3395319 RepID=UPI003EBC652B
MINKILGFITNPFAELIGGWQARKTIAAQTASELAQAESNLKIAKVNAKIQRTKSQDESDISYDMQVLKNRALSYMDEVLIIFWLVVFVLHFIPEYAQTMQAGWVAINKAPWWFQFGMLGILVSTLGLFKLFRMWTEKKFSFGGKS